MAKILFDGTTYGASEPFIGIESVQFKNDGDIPYIIIENKNPLQPIDKFYRIQLTSNGGITRERSADGQTWEWETNHATSMSYGAVEVSDQYTDTGSSVDGKVPSQYALNDAVKVKTITSTRGAGASSISGTSIKRAGNVVDCYFEVTMSRAGVALTGLPAVAHGQVEYILLHPSTFSSVSDFVVATLMPSGQLNINGAGTFSGHFTYITSA